jgi:hypothetical protein
MNSLKYDQYTMQFYTRCLDFFLYLLLDETYHGFILKTFYKIYDNIVAYIINILQL